MTAAGNIFQGGNTVFIGGCPGARSGQQDRSPDQVLAGLSVLNEEYCLVLGGKAGQVEQGCNV